MFETQKHTKARGGGDTTTQAWKGIYLRDRMENVLMNESGGEAKITPVNTMKTWHRTG